MKLLTIIAFLSICDIQGFAQDRIYYTNGFKEYVDKVDSVDGKHLYYQLDGYSYKIPLPIVMACEAALINKKKPIRKI